ncbi:MAG: PKD domain-containing protein [Bacteroidetes bacterium]|nr:PKD domain-containing protein [Bacteroidota bacterium]
MCNYNKNYAAGHKAIIFLKTIAILVAVFSWSNCHSSPVDFSSNFQTVVTGHPVTFAPLITLVPPVTYQWSFPGGTPATSTNSNPVVTYYTSGYYNVSLTVTSQGVPVTESKTQYIHIIPSPEFRDLTGRENDQWYFRDQNVFSFENSGQALVVSQATVTMDSYEGDASISNGDGNLLFYGSSHTLYNRHNQVMQNGNSLLGGISSTQGILIVPQPARFLASGINQNYGKYYVFTTDHYAQSLGFRYSIVDMNLDGGLGGVMPGAANKNVLVYTPVSEKLIAVVHNNKHDLWIITHAYPQNQFQVFLLNENGFNTTPVISTVGTPLTDPGQTAGELVASLNGDKIAQVLNYPSPNIEIFPFNNQTGIVSPGFEIPNTSEADKYGLEFSRSGRFIYYASAYNSWIKQIDLASPGFPSTTVVPYATGQIGVIELGPDGKIYASFFSRTTGPAYGGLVINNPDSQGTACNAQTFSLPTKPLFNLHNKIPFPAFSISGQVTDGAGQGIGGVQIREGNVVLATTSTGTGAYSFDEGFGWSGTIAPAPVAGYSAFIPSSITYSNLNSSQSNQNYIAIPVPAVFSISGRVGISGTANGLPGVTITAGNSGGNAASDGQGYYTITNVPSGWTGDLAATYPPGGYSLTGPLIMNTPLAGNLVNQDFTATPITYVISGHIRLLPVDVDLDGVTITASNGNMGNPSPGMTDSTGYYQVTVPENWSGTITPSKPGFVFKCTLPGIFFGQDYIDYTQVTANKTNQDFIIRY